MRLTPPQEEIELDEGHHMKYDRPEMDDRVSGTLNIYYLTYLILTYE